MGSRASIAGQCRRSGEHADVRRDLSICPHTELIASGVDVGLRPGQIGNSEVGHLNIGAGFVVIQAIRQIDVAIEDGSFFQNDALLKAVRNAKSRNRPLHLIGLLSDGGVHSHIDHLQALLDLAHREELRDVAIHAFLDGRDTSPTGGAEYLRQVEKHASELGVGRVASIIGRYYAMDRDHRWQRTRRAFDLLVHGKGEHVNSAVAGVVEKYTEEITDEFMEPLVVGEKATTISKNDSVIFFDFRSDRARQITQALNGPEIDGADFSDRPENLTFVGLLPYASFLDIDSAFEPVTVREPLASVVSEAGLRQFHTAETEKYAHVTYFINGGREEPFPGEERRMVQSPEVATYDLQPAMSADGVADGAVEAIRSGDFDFVVINFANPDMVGHTGFLDAAIQACETVDFQLSRVLGAIRATHGAALIIADHGNAEQMFVPGTTNPMTAHTTNPVPCVLVNDNREGVTLRPGGRLADIAPTLLYLLGITPPASMTGTSLIEATGG
ncbi:MAG: 2,3-bisphosphoglycerate-independent phosphoglycerate mutase [Thermomicrobiales bacterium]